MRYVCKNPPGGGGRNPYQLIDYLFEGVGGMLDNSATISSMSSTGIYPL